MSSVLIKSVYEGRRAKIINKNHFHFDAIAKCLGIQRTSIGLGYVFKCIETDIEFFVFDLKDVKFID